MISAYEPCPCESGKKFKFCCLPAFMAENSPELAKLSTIWPIYDCYIGKDWQEVGKTMVMVIRTMPTKLFFSSFFLIDAFCLGVKDTYTRLNLGQKDLEFLKDGLDNAGCGGVISIPYADARSIIFGAVAYAQTLGFDPYKDWHKTKYALEPETSFDDKFEFGYKGKPFYVMGPYDSENLDVKAIIKKVKALGGDCAANFENGPI